MSGSVVSTCIRCSTPADLPAFIGHAHAVVTAGNRFGWWTQDDGAEPRLAFVLDMDGAAYRLCSAEGEIISLFVEFLNALGHGLSPDECMPPGRPATAAPLWAH